MTWSHVESTFEYRRAKWRKCANSTSAAELWCCAAREWDVLSESESNSKFSHLSFVAPYRSSCRIAFALLLVFLEALARRDVEDVAFGAHGIGLHLLPKKMSDTGLGWADDAIVQVITVADNRERTGPAKRTLHRQVGQSQTPWYEGIESSEAMHHKSLLTGGSRKHRNSSTKYRRAKHRTFEGVGFNRLADYFKESLRSCCGSSLVSGDAYLPPVEL